MRAVWNKGSTGVVEATHEVEQALPFALLGFDCDNGREFLNWHLVRYFQERPQAVGFTRSRPYKKNDNAHVEQKNWSHVRQLVGYDRLGEARQVAALQRLYREAWEPLHNFFLPSMKLVKKQRLGARYQKHYDAPQTPCKRLLQSPAVSVESKAQLRAKRAALALDSRGLGRYLRRRHHHLLSLPLCSSVGLLRLCRFGRWGLFCSGRSLPR